MKITFKNVLIGEVLKSKNTFGYLLSLLFPCLITVVFTFIFLTVGDYNANRGVSSWNLLGTIVFLSYAFLFPIYTFLIAFLMNNIEYRTGGFEHIFALPVPKKYFYVSKIILIVYWLSASFILAYALFMLAGNILSIILPNLRLAEYSISLASALFFFQLYIGCLNLLAIHFLISIYFDSFLKSVGLGMILLISGVFLAKQDYAYFFPYSFPMVLYQDFRMDHTTLRTLGIAIQLLYAILFFLYGFFMIRKKYS